MEWQTIILALIAMSSAPILAYLTSVNSRQDKASEAALRRQEKTEDYRRQDLVAERVQMAAARAEKVAIKVDETATSLKTVNEGLASRASEAAIALKDFHTRIAEQTNMVSGKLDVIHTLVNSTLSAAMQAELNAFVGLLAIMKNPGKVEDQMVIDTEKKVADLKAIIEERDKQTQVAARQIVENAQAATALAASKALPVIPQAPAPVAPGGDLKVVSGTLVVKT